MPHLVPKTQKSTGLKRFQTSVTACPIKKDPKGPTGPNKQVRAAHRPQQKTSSIRTCSTISVSKLNALSLKVVIKDCSERSVDQIACVHTLKGICSSKGTRMTPEILFAVITICTLWFGFGAFASTARQRQKLEADARHNALVSSTPVEVLAEYVRDGGGIDYAALGRRRTSSPLAESRMYRPRHVDAPKPAYLEDAMKRDAEEAAEKVMEAARTFQRLKDTVSEKRQVRALSPVDLTLIEHIKIC